MLLHTGRWTSQFIEEQIGVAGAHLAGGHGCDAAERQSMVRGLARGAQSRRVEGLEGYVTSGLPTMHPYDL